MSAQRTDEPTPLSIIHEQAALACPLVDENTLDEMAGLEPAHFQLDLHAVIWQAMRRVHAAGTPLTLPAVLTDLQTLLVGQPDQWAVARSYVPQLTVLHPVPVGADYYAAQVQEYARWRKAREKAALLLDYGDEDLRGLAVVQDMAALVAEPAPQSAPRTQAQVVGATLDAIEERRTSKTAAGLPTGLPTVGQLNGFRPGHFVVLAARPGVGKTLLAYQMAQHMAAAGHVGLYVSLEMNAEELEERMLVAESLVPALALSQAALTEDHWGALLAAGQTLSGRPLHVIDAGGVTLDTVLGWARRYTQSARLAVLVLDYVQLFPMPNPERVTQQAALAVMTKRLKAAARQLGICIIALSQLNRPGEGARPGLVNLSGSDTLGHDADLVLTLWPDEEYGNDGLDTAGLRHLVLAAVKNRHGLQRTTPLLFNPMTLTMREVTR
jgi:replicative DNA helicase